MSYAEVAMNVPVLDGPANISESRAGRQAVVIGAGIGGLAAACVLADHFDRVLILERDRLLDAAAPRHGTPQACHVHGLLAGGLAALTELLPGFDHDLRRAGAVALNGTLNVRLERPGFDPFPARDVGVMTYAASRPLIEFVLRQRVAKVPGVELHAPCRVSEILATADGLAVTGVRCDDIDGQARVLPADLIVDASGRGELTLALLRATGRAAPPQTTIGVDIGYASAVYDIPRDPARTWDGVMTFPQAPQSSRGALMLPQEGQRWVLSLGGRGADKPPGDDAGFLDFARHLRTDTIYNAIRDARRVGAIHRYVFPQSVRRHFDKVPDFPRGLLPMGDAVCVFNPVYGQGMSVAAQEALLLRRLLAQGRGQPSASAVLSQAFIAALPTVLETPWAMAAIPDFIFAQTIGERPPDLARRLSLGFAMLRLAARRPDVHKTNTQVQHLLVPLDVYRSPVLRARLLLEVIRGRAVGLDAAARIATKVLVTPG
jgi:2-polyprenyl-6-methoxyphenol hydroxylase-like FAD-dependent oxidoreductase